MRIISGGICETGDRRENNQDHILYVNRKEAGHETGLFLVADGMGGLACGMETSGYIVQEFLRWWEQDVSWMFAYGKTSDEDILELLDQEIWDINQEILKFTRETGQRTGSTLSLLFIMDGKYYIKHLGDSRIYRSHSDRIRQITEDQTTVQKVRRRSGEEYYKSVLTMCVGIPERPEAYTTVGTLDPEDCFLLCSDGLYKCLKFERIQEILQKIDLNPEETVWKLRHAIPDGDALDNVSAIVVRVSEECE